MRADLARAGGRARVGPVLSLVARTLADALVDPLVDLVLPRACLGCGTAGVALCGACAQAQVHRVEAGGIAVRAAAGYGGPVRAALIAYKERGRRDLARPLADLLSVATVGAVRAAGAGPGRRPVLVPVPSAAAARRRRGGDHVLRLARSAARTTGLALSPALRLGRPVADSAGLHSAERALNMSGAMRAAPPIGPPAEALLVDDIVTTGATLREAARALQAAGWSVAGAAVVAATPLRHGSRRSSAPHLARGRPRGLP